MFCVTDPVEIFGMLEQYGEDNFDTRKNHFSFFPCEIYFALFLFCSEGTQKGPRVYLFDRAMLYSEIEHKLTGEFNNCESDGAFTALTEAAMDRLRTMIETQAASGHFFDAH